MNAAHRSTRPLGLVGTLAWFGGFGLLMVITTRTVIPALLDFGVHPHLAWFAAGAPVFAGMFVAVAWQLRAERSRWTFGALLGRLRVGPMRRSDWKLVGIAAAITCIGSTSFIALGLDPAPDFMHVGPLAQGERHVLLWWIPFFAMNILGEELLWRGMLLPRHELTFGSHAWLVHGLGWVSFHISFGAGMLVVTAPLILAQSWACQRSGNTTVGIVHHGLINGAGFLMLAFVSLP